MAVEVWSIPSAEMYSGGGGRYEKKEACGVEKTRSSDGEAAPRSERRGRSRINVEAVASCMISPRMSLTMSDIMVWDVLL